jgi:hypothetical protein
MLPITEESLKKIFSPLRKTSGGKPLLDVFFFVHPADKLPYQPSKCSLHKEHKK